MKIKLYGLIALCCVYSLMSCLHNETCPAGVSFSLEKPNDDLLKEIKLFVFSDTELLIILNEYPSAKSLEGALTVLPPGDYTFVVLTNSNGVFEHNGRVGETYLNEFLVSLSSDVHSPEHAHYGQKTVTLREGTHSSVAIQLNRALSEISMTVSDIPDEVTSVRIEILNSTTGFYPGSQKLHTATQTVLLGEGSPQNNMFSPETIRLLPVTTFRSELLRSDVRTHMAVYLTYDNGGEISFMGTGPALQNGGVYTPEVEYRIFRPGIDFEINDINGWQELPPLYGEILMPD
ncbi:MAG: FimB/Mfa2 family fimbrial subunit [Bacteroidales bacterium]